MSDVSRQCGFCQRWFQSKQSVRAHLRHCPNYLAAKAAGLVTPKPAREKYRCGVCGHVQTTDFSTCPQCGAVF